MALLPGVHASHMRAYNDRTAADSCTDIALDGWLRESLLLSPLPTGTEESEDTSYSSREW